MTTDEVRRHWDERYSARPAMWSGKVNASLSKAFEALRLTHPSPSQKPRALDLGSGEGGDALWLASLGYEVVGVDISTVAVERARARAAAENAGQAVFYAADALEWSQSAAEAGETFEVILASFFQSHVSLDRTGILRAASRLLAPGGTIVLVSHAAMPPWALTHMSAQQRAEHHKTMPTVDGERELLTSAGLEPVISEIWTRTATGPHGQLAELEDVISAFRKPAA